MKINIRQSVFETNSSSMHSVAIIGCNRPAELAFTFNSEDKIMIYPGEYGWGYEILRGPEEKLSYAITMITQRTNDGCSPEESIYFQWLNDMVFDYTGHYLQVVELQDKWNPYGYIDHQSIDTLDDFWSSDENVFKEKMRDFIFNDKYFIIIDNDNH
jgi:hypothetical protein